MATIVDLSHTLDATTTVYPGDPTFSCCPALTLEKDGFNVKSLSLGTHTGTHIDAPYHVSDDGETIDNVSLSSCKGPVFVVDVTGRLPRERIMWSDIASLENDLQHAISRGAMVLFRTGWSQHWATDAYFNHPFLDGDIARRLVEMGASLVGIDALSPDETHVEEQEGVPMDFTVHQVLLPANVIIAENLTKLDEIQLGTWTACMAPLKIAGGDGSPVRAFAWRER